MCVVRVVNRQLIVTEKNGEKGETKRNAQNDTSTLLNSFWYKVPLEFYAFFLFATHLETSQLIWFTNQLAGIYRICKNIESDLGHVGPNTFSCF